MGLIGELIQMVVGGGLDFGFNQLDNYMQNRGADQAIQDYYKAIGQGQSQQFALPTPSTQTGLPSLPGLNYPNFAQPTATNIHQGGTGGQLTANMLRFPELANAAIAYQNRPYEQAQELEKQL